MKRLFIVIAPLWVSFMPRVACGCVCGREEPALAFNGAQAVFVGRMLGGTERLSAQDQDGKPYHIEAGEVRFAVEQVFKGSLGAETTIRISSNRDTDCGPYGLKRGERYVVYAYRNTEEDGELETGVCTRTSAVDSSDAKEDLGFLRNLPPAGTGGNLSGRVWADLRGGATTPLANIKVVIRGPDDRAVTVNTGTNGQFEVRNLKPGKYRVEPYFPPNYVSEHRIQEVVVDDLGTASVGFEAYLDGRILGKIIDQSGRGFNSIFLHLVAPGKSVSAYSTGEGGMFEAAGVPPGEYTLYVEMWGEGWKSSKKYYYPGTFQHDQAGVIKVGLGETVEGLVFSLPEGYDVRTIAGRVTWEDGSPASGVTVSLLCPQTPRQNGFVFEFLPTSTVTNDLGQFQIEGFLGEVYWIEASGSLSSKKDEIIYLHSGK